MTIAFFSCAKLRGGKSIRRVTRSTTWMWFVKLIYQPCYVVVFIKADTIISREMRSYSLCMRGSSENYPQTGAECGRQKKPNNYACNCLTTKPRFHASDNVDCYVSHFLLPPFNVLARRFLAIFIMPAEIVNCLCSKFSLNLSVIELSSFGCAPHSGLLGIVSDFFLFSLAHFAWEWLRTGVGPGPVTSCGEWQ